MIMQFLFHYERDGSKLHQILHSMSVNDVRKVWNLEIKRSWSEHNCDNVSANNSEISK